MEFALLNFKGKHLEPRIGKLAMATAIYCVWQERNQRIFQQRIRSNVQVLKDIEGYVKAKAWLWESKRNYSNWVVCRS